MPGLIAASVWIAPSIVKPSGAVSSRCSALTMPLVTVPSSPNGLPIATTRSPISSDSDEPSSTGVTPLGMLSSSSTATSDDASAPTTLAPTSSPLGNRTVTLVALSTTCWFVSTWPSSSITKPLPVAPPPPCPGRSGEPCVWVVTRTTPSFACS